MPNEEQLTQGINKEVGRVQEEYYDSSYLNSYCLFSLYRKKMKRISRKNLCYRFDKNLEPAIKIDPGERLIIETQDAYSRTVPEGSLGENVPFTELTEENANPVTGPVFIRQAKPGNTLAIFIEDTKVDSQGFVPIRPDCGVFTDKVKKPCTRVILIRNGFFFFSERICLPLRPMVGTIGVAPSERAIATVYPGPHGGNMDNNYVRRGATVFLPISAEGALLALGDVHASMGDGEITSGGIDISAEVTVKVDVLEHQLLPRPYIETTDLIVTCGNASSFDEARKLVIKDMVTILMKKMSLTDTEALMLISARGDLGICQACNCPIDITMRVVFPKLWEGKTFRFREIQALKNLNLFDKG